MGYSKLTVEQFAANLKAGRYAGLTGARRAIGKTSGWNDAERKRAHGVADKHFGSAGAATSATTQPKTAAKKTVKKTAAPKAAAKTATPKAAKTPKAPKTAKRASKVLGVDSSTKELSLVGRLLQADDPMTVRQNSASTVIAAYRNAGPLNPLEQRAYDVATAEYAVGASPAAVQALADATTAEPTAKPKKSLPTPAPQVGSTLHVPPAVAVTGASPSNPATVTAPRIALPESSPRLANPENGSVDLKDLTPEEREQHERLAKAAQATGIPVPPMS